MARKLSYLLAINEAMHQEMARDETVIVLGEDIAGGAGLGDAADDRREHDRGDEHLHELDEAVAERLHGSGAFGREDERGDERRLEQAVAAGKLKAGAEVSVADLVAAGVIRRELDGVKLLGKGSKFSPARFSETSSSFCSRRRCSAANIALNWSRSATISGIESGICASRRRVDSRTARRQNAGRNNSVRSPATRNPSANTIEIGRAHV